jgi:hypothetical protein
MHQCNNHPIYGIAIPGPGKKWYCRGLIFDPEDKVTEIKRFDYTESTFASKKTAEEHALNLCKKWLGEQSGGIQSSDPTGAVPPKRGVIVM